MERKKRPLGTAAIFGEKMSHAVRIMLPDYMFDWVEAKIGSGECRSRGEVVRRLIEREMRRLEQRYGEEWR